jgi:hypothetical protein
MLDGKRVRFGAPSRRSSPVRKKANICYMTVTSILRDFGLVLGIALLNGR